MRTRAFSCNYRDRSRVVDTAVNAPGLRVRPFGSDFVGEVVEVGSEVSTLQPGDRVIPDATYHASSKPLSISSNGLPNDVVSQEFLVVEADKLMRIPDRMPDHIAAAFTVGAQTAFAMVRKLQLEAGERVLVLGAKSNTSLCAIQALALAGVEVYAASRTDAFAEELAAMGVRELIVLGRERPTGDFAEHPRVRALRREFGGFDAIVDPFADLHLAGSIRALGLGGRYVTCGVFAQHQLLVGDQPATPGADLSRVLPELIPKSLTIHGNCLGNRDDLARAVAAHEQGTFDVVIDSVHHGGAIGEFIHRSYGAQRRVGKAVYAFHERD